MARISLIICDLCKEELSPEESQEEYSLTLFSLTQKEHTAETCKRCFSALLGRLNSKFKLPRPEKTTEKPQNKPAATSRVTAKNSEENLYDPVTEFLGPTEEEKRGRAVTEELLDDEIQKIPSRFDKTIARKTVKKIKGPCAHHFKSWADGKVVCAPPPPGYEGEFETFRGCGKALTAAEY